MLWRKRPTDKHSEFHNSYAPFGAWNLPNLARCLEVISSELASLGSLVAYDAIMVVFLFQIEYVNRIHSCKAEYHHCNIMSKLCQGLGAVGRRERSSKEGSALFHGYGSLLWSVRLWNFHFQPRICCYSHDTIVIVVEIKQTLLEYLTDTHRVHLLGSCCCGKRLYPSIDELGCKLREHDLVGTCIAFHRQCYFQGRR